MTENIAESLGKISQEEKYRIVFKKMRNVFFVNSTRYNRNTLRNNDL